MLRDVAAEVRQAHVSMGTPEVNQLCRLGEELCEAARDVLDYTLPSVMAQHRLGKAVKAWDDMMQDRFQAAIERIEET